MNKKGQSLVEVVVAVGIVILVTSGVVALMVNVLGGRTRSFDRKKATELAQKVVENMVADKTRRGNEFWAGNYWSDNFSTNMTDPNFDGYFYNVTTNNVSGGIEATVIVGWEESSTDTVSVSRLFTPN